MADLATLKSRIARETHRSDINDDIADAIADSIAYYQASNFAFSQTQATLTTVAGQEYYSDLDDIAAIDCITKNVNGRKAKMDEWGFQSMERVNTTTNTTNEPFAWSWYKNKIRLYPIPDQAYELLVSYTQKIDIPATDSASNVWTEEAGELIRHAAKVRLYRDVLLDSNAMVLSAGAESSAYANLIKDANQLASGPLAAHE